MKNKTDIIILIILIFFIYSLNYLKIYENLLLSYKKIIKYINHTLNNIYSNKSYWKISNYLSIPIESSVDIVSTKLSSNYSYISLKVNESTFKDKVNILVNDKYSKVYDKGDRDIYNIFEHLDGTESVVKPKPKSRVVPTGHRSGPPEANIKALANEKARWKRFEEDNIKKYNEFEKSKTSPLPFQQAIAPPISNTILFLVNFPLPIEFKSNTIKIDLNNLTHLI